MFKVNTAKKISLWILATLLVAWAFLPDGFSGDRFEVNVLLAAVGTLTLWVALVLLASWIFGLAGSLSRLIRKSYRQSAISIPVS